MKKNWRKSYPLWGPGGSEAQVWGTCVPNAHEYGGGVVNSCEKMFPKYEGEGKAEGRRGERAGTGKAEGRRGERAGTGVKGRRERGGEWSRGGEGSGRAEKGKRIRGRHRRGGGAEGRRRGEKGGEGGGTGRRGGASLKVLFSDILKKPDFFKRRSFIFRPESSRIVPRSPQRSP